MGGLAFLGEALIRLYATHITVTHCAHWRTDCSHRNLKSAYVTIPRYRTSAGSCAATHRLSVAVSGRLCTLYVGSSLHTKQRNLRKRVSKRRVN